DGRWVWANIPESELAQPDMSSLPNYAGTEGQRVAGQDGDWVCAKIPESEWAGPDMSSLPDYNGRFLGASVKGEGGNWVWSELPKSEWPAPDMDSLPIRGGTLGERVPGEGGEWMWDISYTWVWRPYIDYWQWQPDILSWNWQPYTKHWQWQSNTEGWKWEPYITHWQWQPNTKVWKWEPYNTHWQWQPNTKVWKWEPYTTHWQWQPNTKVWKWQPHTKYWQWQPNNQGWVWQPFIGQEDKWIHLPDLPGGAQLIGENDTGRYYLLITREGRRAYFKESNGDVYYWQVSLDSARAYRDALESEWGGWLRWIPGMPIPTEGVIARHVGDDVYYWQPSIKATERYIEAIKGYGFWSPDVNEISVFEDIMFWTPQEIKQRGLPLELDEGNSKHGWLTIDGQKIETVFTPGQKGGQEYIAALEAQDNPFGGYIEVGMDGQRTWVYSIQASRSAYYNSTILEYNSQEGTVTKYIQYYIPAETPQGTSFIPFGKPEINTFKGGVLLTQIKDGVKITNHYGSEYDVYNLPYKSTVTSTDGEILISESTITNVDISRGIIEKEEVYYAGSRQTVIKTESNTYDLKGRLIEKRLEDKVTLYYYEGSYGEYGIATSAETFILDASGERELFVSSKLVGFENGNVVVQLINHKTKAVWQQVHNGLGRISIYYYGRLNQEGDFIRQVVEYRTYEGLIGLYEIADTSTSWLCTPEGTPQGQPIDVSFILDRNGDRIESATANIEEIFDEQDRIRYQGVEYHYQNGELVAVLNYQEIKDSQGRILERHIGSVNAQGIFIPESKIYNFYDPTSNLGRFDIANATVATLVIDGKESIVSHSNYSYIDEEGKIYYSIRRGDGSIKQEINYNNLQENLANIQFEYISKTWQEVKGAQGRLVIIKDGYLKVDPDSGFLIDEAGELNDDPRFITFLIYPEQGDVRIATEGVTYEYISGNQDYEYYRDNKKPVAQIDNFRIEDGILIYDVKDNRANRASIAEMGLRLDGRLYYELYEGKWGKDDTTKLYFDERELPFMTYSVESKWAFSIGGWDFFSSDSEQPLYEHYVVFIEGKPGYYWVWDRNVNDSGIGYEFSEFIDGNQISKDNPRVQVLPEAEAAKLGQRNGRYFASADLIFERRDRFTPVVWVDYKDGIEEYFDIHLREHIKNNAIYNLFLEARERGTLLPLIVCTIGAIAAITLFLPIVLLIIPGVLSWLHFRKTGRKREGTSGVVAGSGPREARDDKVDSIEDVNPEIRQRIAVILLGLSSIGQFVQYLNKLYIEGGFLEADPNEKRNKERALLERFYPGWDGVDNSPTYPRRTDEVWPGYAEKFNLELTEIERLIIEPLAYIFLAATAKDSRNLDEWSGGRGWEDGNPFEKFKKEQEAKGIPPILVADRDFRRFLEYCQEDGIDPIIDFNLNRFLPDVRQNVVVTSNDAKSESDRKKEFAETHLRDPIRQYLGEKYKEKGFKPFVFPQPFAEGSWQRKVLKIGLAVLGVGLYGFFAIQASSLLIAPFGWFALALYALFAWQLVEMTPMAIYFVRYKLGALWTIYKTRKEYQLFDAETKQHQGPYKDIIKQKSRFFKRLFGYWIAINLAISGLSLFFAWGVFPLGLWNLIISGGLVLGFTLIVSLRTVWVLCVEAVSQSLEDQGHWRDIVHYSDISRERLEKINNDPYLEDLYNIVLIDETLRKYFLVTEEEAEALRIALSTGKMPVLENPRAKRKIIDFFNKLNLYSREEFEQMLSLIQENPEKFLRVFTKITARDQKTIPARIEMDAVGDIKTPFRLLKEAFAGDWI
ncbi:MAG: hypothetical protein PVI33_05605, partial [Candidatus Omnitrophota bacterium]